MFRLSKGHFQGVTTIVERSVHNHIHEIQLWKENAKLGNSVDVRDVTHPIDTDQGSNF
jgi:hypothetical protein